MRRAFGVIGAERPTTPRSSVLCAQNRIQRSSRLLPTPSQNRSSGSVDTSTSSGDRSPIGGGGSRRTDARPRRRGCRTRRCQPGALPPPRTRCRGSARAGGHPWFEVLDHQSETLGPGQDRGIGQQPPVGGDAEGAGGQIWFAASTFPSSSTCLAERCTLGVRWCRPVSRPDPAVDPVLRARNGTGDQYPVGRAVAVGRVGRHRQVGLLGPRLDLAEDRLRGQRAEVGGVGVRKRRCSASR